MLRGHFHTPVNEVLEVGNYESRLMVLPAMCMATNFARKVTQSVRKVTNGITAFVIDGSEISKPIKMWQTVDIRTDINL